MRQTNLRQTVDPSASSSSTETNPPTRRKDRFPLRFSEKTIGYLFVLPTILLIAAIAIWPVVRSFWLSLYDIRLNDPAKTAIHRTYGLDMEVYAGKYPLLLRALDREIKQADAPTKTSLAEAKDRLESLHDELMKDEDFAERWEEVNRLLDAFQPVPPNLKTVDLDRDEAERVKATLRDVEKTLAQIDPAKLQRPNDVTGLLSGISGALIEPNFVGFAHYTRFLHEPRLWMALWNTTVFTVVSVSLELVLGLGIALLINRSFKGRGLVRAAVLIPWAIPTVISALMWKFLYDGQNGIVAKLFAEIGIIDNMATLLTTKWGAMFAVIFADVWKTTPFMALLLLAGLQTIPQSLYEAAEVDGASRIQQFFRITLPLLKPTILVALLFRTLDAFRVFDLIYVLTGGGPANSTETISIYAYKTMFAQLNFGAGSALSVIVFLCVALISIFYIKLLGANVLGEEKAR
ncbi:hypothetical protein JCM14720_02190 [Calditerricola yamamurae]